MTLRTTILFAIFIATPVAVVGMILGEWLVHTVAGWLS